MATPRTPEFLHWLAGRLVGVYGESVHTDFVLRLEEEAERSRTLRANLAMNQNTYQLVQVGEPRASDGKHGHVLNFRGKPGRIGMLMWLTEQEAADLARQLDAPIDYFND